YPPPLNANGFSRGKRFRNHKSTRHARFVFLFQCAANPLIQCGQSFATPTVVVSNPGAGRWYSANANQYPTRITPSAIHFTRAERIPSRNRKPYPRPICVSVSSNVKKV